MPSEDKNAEWHQQEGEEELTSSEERVTECTAGVTHRELMEDKTNCQENQVQKEIEVDYENKKCQQDYAKRLNQMWRIVFTQPCTTQ